MDCDDCRYGKKTLRINGTVVVCMKKNEMKEECDDFKLTELLYTTKDLDTADLELIRGRVKKEERGVYEYTKK